MIDVISLIFATIFLTHSVTAIYKLYFIPDVFEEKMEKVLENRGMKGRISIDSLIYIYKGIYTFLIAVSAFWFVFSLLTVLALV